MCSKITPATGGKPEECRKPGLTLIGVLVTLIVLGAMAAIFVPRIIRKHREARENALDQALADMMGGSLERVKEALEAYPQLLHAKEELGGLTPLHYAALNGEETVAELLLTKGADVHARDRDMATSLHWAAEGGHKGVAGLLLAGDADAGAKDRFGMTPLHRAALWGHKDVVQVLLEGGAQIDVFAAAALGEMSILSGHVERGADVVSTRAEGGWTLLHFAAGAGQSRAVGFLLDGGADVGAKDNAGESPLHQAAGWGHKDVAELLLANGADVDAKDYDGEAPLHETAKGRDRTLYDADGGGCKGVAEVLLAKGADVNAKNHGGETPLSMATWSYQKELAELLKKHGAKEEEALPPPDRIPGHFPRHEAERIAAGIEAARKKPEGDE